MVFKELMLLNPTFMGYEDLIRKVPLEASTGRLCTLTHALTPLHLRVQQILTPKHNFGTLTVDNITTTPR